MTTNLTRAIEILKSRNYTCAIVNGDSIYTSRERGVKPLLDWFYSDIDTNGYAAADKVIGKAAAYLYVLLEIKEIYTMVISEPAYEVMKKYGIEVHYEQLVDAIRNRTNTGFCPMETAVMDIDNADDALIAIRNKISELAGR